MAYLDDLEYSPLASAGLADFDADRFRLFLAFLAAFDDDELFLPLVLGVGDLERDFERDRDMAGGERLLVRTRPRADRSLLGDRLLLFAAAFFGRDDDEAAFDELDRTAYAAGGLSGVRDRRVLDDDGAGSGGVRFLKRLHLYQQYKNLWSVL